ncbi:hypothetical protein FOZ60_007180 [Perkinsus olseni]|uniref:Uncharacterized protein n=1 Tax=Perkinsus olseni TaxID=32597 RepID=A0A7J6NLV4_PEROL|nr:hypothetical protein FOZ60_007180 [Perkinsus olseni]
MQEAADLSQQKAAQDKMSFILAGSFRAGLLCVDEDGQYGHASVVTSAEDVGGWWKAGVAGRGLSFLVEVMADDDEEAPISVNIAASIPFPRDEKTFKTLEMLPDDLYKVRQWGLSQNQTESNQIAMTGAMLPPDLSRQLELEGDVSLLPRWDAFRRRRLLSAKELIGQGTLYHARRTIKKGSSETLREFWGRVRCLTEINDPCLSTDDINRRTAEQFALGLPNDLQLPLMEKINEKGTMSPAEVLALVDRKERRHRITKTLYVMKRSREESTSDEEDEDGPPPDKRTRSSRESSRPAGKGKGGKGKGRSRDAEDRDHHHNGVSMIRR